jgi:hypothetical protein
MFAWGGHNIDHHQLFQNQGFVQMQDFAKLL